MHRFLLFFVVMVLCCAVVTPAEEPPAPAILLTLNDAVTDPASIDYDALPRLAGQHAVVCPTTDALKFQLHNYLLHHDGKYWCMFSHGPVVEDVPTQRVSYATSVDGLTWSAAQPLTPLPAEPYAYIARGFWLRDGELLALVAHYRGKGAFGDNKELQLQAFAWDAQGEVWKFKATLYQDAINNFAPQRLPGGEWLMTRRDSKFNVYMLAGGVKALDDWQSFPVVERTSVPNFSPDEPFWWQLPDGRLHALFRDNGRSGRLYQAFSDDRGRTWSRPAISNFPNARSKCYPLRISTGWWAMISNANPARGRHELHLSLSRDGLTFTRLARLAIPHAGDSTFQYPHAIEQDGQVCIAFSRDKHQTEILRVPLDAIEKLTR
jgi:hypothetical protein